MSTIQGARKVLRISWAQAWLLEKKAVARGLRLKSGRPVRALGIDEKSIARGHVYATIFSDLDRGTVEHVEDDRKEESLGRYLRRMRPRRREALEVIALDMWEAYFIAIRKHLPGWEAKTVIDRYHLMVRIGRALDLVRAKEHRELKQAGDRSLKRSRYLWLHSRENLRREQAERLEALLHKPLRTARAWALKESFRELWNQSTREAAARHFRQWYFWATHSRLWPIIQAAKSFRIYLSSILNYFSHRMTNAVAEGLNSKIQGILKSAYGYRNRENFKIAVYFHCGGLSLYPVTHAKMG
jgi:transposase